MSFQATQLSGKSQFPFMVDPNTGQKMGESDDIINYLWDEYGDGNVPLLLKLGPLTAISNTLALLPRCFLKSNVRMCAHWRKALGWCPSACHTTDICSGGQTYSMKLFSLVMLTWY